MLILSFSDSLSQVQAAVQAAVTPLARAQLMRHSDRPGWQDNLQKQLDELKAEAETPDDDDTDDLETERESDQSFRLTLHSYHSYCST